MFRALYTAASGMLAQQLNLDNIANNLANASTVGFRGTRLQFQDLIYQEMVVPGSAATQQTTVSTGCKSAWARAPRRLRSCRHRATLTTRGTRWTWRFRAQVSSR